MNRLPLDRDHPITVSGAREAVVVAGLLAFAPACSWPVYTRVATALGPSAVLDASTPVVDVRIHLDSLHDEFTIEKLEIEAEVVAGEPHPANPSAIMLVGPYIRVETQFQNAGHLRAPDVPYPTHVPTRVIFCRPTEDGLDGELIVEPWEVSLTAHSTHEEFETDLFEIFVEEFEPPTGATWECPE